MPIATILNQVFVDADGCPVVNQTIALCRQYGVDCILICDTAHQMQREGATTITVSKGADSVDYALVNRVKAGDLVITQDYGLAAMCLARRAIAVHQNGLVFDEYNIDSLLLSRHINRKVRMAGGRTKGPAKRTEAQNQAFCATLEGLLQKMASCQ